MKNARQKAQPDFNNLLAVLQRQRPDRPTMFEFFLNDSLYSELAGEDIFKQPDDTAKLRVVIKAYRNAGYDFATVPSWFTDTMQFPKPELAQKSTRSINAGQAVTDQASFEAYPWPDPANGRYEIYDELESSLPDGLKLIACGPGGVLENVIDLVGYERLCFMTLEDPELTRVIFEAVGSRLVGYYDICADFDSIGALIVNDDWGFKSQTMLPPESMRDYVFPWHKKIVEVIHAHQKPAILHSCGNVNAVMDDIIHDMKFDAKHSFEDGILPVEEVYTRWGADIAILGGIDLDFLARKSPAAVKQRAEALLQQTRCEGYALGSGNSIPAFIPTENYYAMISTINKE